MIFLKKIILSIFIISLFIFSPVLSANPINDTQTLNNSFKNNIAEVKVAILSEDPIGWGSLGKQYLIDMFSDYEWVSGNTFYEFKVTEIYDKDILNGDLNTKNYDVFIVPGAGEGDGESVAKGFPLFPKAQRWKEKISDFVKSGGGYVGICGGTALMTDLSKEPQTFMERQYEKSAIGVSCLSSYYNNCALQFYYPLQKCFPERTAPASYIFEFPPGDLWDETGVYPNGIPFDMEINSDHPIFDDFLEEFERVRWVGGPALDIPDTPSNEVTVLGYYPGDGLSGNDSTDLQVWRYVGGIRGKIKGFFKTIQFFKENNYPFSLFDAGYSLQFFASDWEKTDKMFDLNFSSKPCMTAEIYNNTNKGRIVLNGPHPEYPVWWGGHIEEMPDTDDNTLDEGLHRWVDITPFSETKEDECTHSWWIVRRSVAWAAKVPDSDLPPIYGPSQVRDIYPYEQSSCFTLKGISEKSDATISLQLCYRHSYDNLSWSSWAVYDSDVDDSDGWSWNFNSTNANGPGYYQFYSKRHIEFAGYEEIEKVPPGPDTLAYVRSE